MEYYLVLPSDCYQDVYENVWRMAYLSHEIINKLHELSKQNRSIEYSKLLEFVSELPALVLYGQPLEPVDEEFLQKHADFPIMHVCCYEEEGNEKDNTIDMLKVCSLIILK